MMMLPCSRGGRSARSDAARHGDAPLSHHRRVARPSSPRTLATTMRGSIMVYGVHHPPLGSAGPKMGMVFMVGRWPPVRARWGSSTSWWTRAVSYTCMASLARAAAGFAPWGRAHGLPIASVWPPRVGVEGVGGTRSSWYRAALNRVRRSGLVTRVHPGAAPPSVGSQWSERASREYGGTRK